MAHDVLFVPLFEKFIRATKTGKRRGYETETGDQDRGQDQTADFRAIACFHGLRAPMKRNWRKVQSDEFYV